MTRTEDIFPNEAVGTLSATEVQDADDRTAKKVVEIVDALVLELDLVGNIVFSNPAVEKHTGYAPSEIEGRPIENAILAPEDVQPWQVALKKLCAGELVQWESDVIAKDGQHRRIQWSCSPVLSEHDTPRSIVATGIDISVQWNLMRGSELSDGAKDRRSQPRRLYPYYQLIAPLVEGTTMDKHAFSEVRCCDISASGFSFISVIVPQHRAFVVAFGTPPSLTYVTAEVVRISPIEADGTTTNLIGCRYTGKVKH